jgi:hypothetical protein
MRLGSENYQQAKLKLLLLYQIRDAVRGSNIYNGNKYEFLQFQAHRESITSISII